MLRLRQYKESDAETILSWCDDKDMFYRWTAGVLGDYPITPEQFQKVRTNMAWTAFEDDEIVGFFIMRHPTTSLDELRFGYVIIDSAKRGQGYAKEMLNLGLIYARDVYKAKKISLVVLEGNEPASRCYKAMGFKTRKLDKPETYEIQGKTWMCETMEYIL